MSLKISTVQLKSCILKSITAFLFTNFSYKIYESIEGGYKWKGVDVVEL